MTKAIFLYGATELGAPHFSADLLWRTKFRVPDPVMYAEVRGRKFLFVSALEFGRAKREADVDAVYEFGALKRMMSEKSATSAIRRFLERKGVSRITVSSHLGHSIAAELKKCFRLDSSDASVFSARAIKTAGEVRQIIQAERAIEESVHKIRAVLRASRIRKNRVFYRGKPLTSEFLRALIETNLHQKGYFASSTIAASGREAAHPHALGHGPIRAGEPIVLDIFPISRATHYFADHTRTLFKGNPTALMCQMYETVRAAQELGIRKVRAGVSASDIHHAVQEYFEAHGYPTVVSSHHAEGFIHGLGHGVGVEIHESPSIGRGSRDVLAAGNVITIEPGLYYPNGIPGLARRSSAKAAGGIRLEDMLLVTKTGSRNLAHTPKSLEWAIIP